MKKFKPEIRNSSKILLLLLLLLFKKKRKFIIITITISSVLKITITIILLLLLLKFIRLKTNRMNAAVCLSVKRREKALSSLYYEETN